MHGIYVAQNAMHMLWLSSMAQFLCTVWHCKPKKNCSMVDICDLEHMFEHLGAENEFKHYVLNHMDMETDN